MEGLIEGEVTSFASWIVAHGPCVCELTNSVPVTWVHELKKLSSVKIAFLISACFRNFFFDNWSVNYTAKNLEIWCNSVCALTTTFYTKKHHDKGHNKGVTYIFVLRRFFVLFGFLLLLVLLFWFAFLAFFIFSLFWRFSLIDSWVVG